MAFSNFTPRHIDTPRPSGSGGFPFDSRAPPIPIYIVTNVFQLPVEFLNPSPERRLVVGFDCEGVELCRHGILCVMQLAFQNAIYLVDAVVGGPVLMNACKPALESAYVTKALYFQFGIKLHNVMDTQIAYTLIEQQEGRMRLPDEHISFVGLLADPRYCGISYHGKEEVRFLLRQDRKFWFYRPFSELMVRAAADDVRFLLYVYCKMMEKLTERSIWCLSVRGALHCRCFCINDNDYADWPPIPPIPDRLKVGGNALKKKYFLFLMFLEGRWDVLLGKKGLPSWQSRRLAMPKFTLGVTGVQRTRYLSWGLRVR